MVNKRTLKCHWSGYVHTLSIRSWWGIRSQWGNTKLKQWFSLGVNVSIKFYDKHFRNGSLVPIHFATVKRE